MKKIVPVFVVAAAAVSGAAAWWFYWPTYLTQQAVKTALNDPDSAKFRGVVFNRETGAGCGYVNAKNRMGGYVGETHFIATSDGQVKFEPGIDVDGLPIEEQIDIANKQIAYLDLMLDECSLEQAEKMSANNMPGKTN